MLRSIVVKSSTISGLQSKINEVLEEIHSSNFVDLKLTGAGSGGDVVAVILVNE